MNDRDRTKILGASGVAAACLGNLTGAVASVGAGMIVGDLSNQAGVRRARRDYEHDVLSAKTAEAAYAAKDTLKARCTEARSRANNVSVLTALFPPLGFAMALHYAGQR